MCFYKLKRNLHALIIFYCKTIVFINIQKIYGYIVFGEIIFFVFLDNKSNVEFKTIINKNFVSYLMHVYLAQRTERELKY